MKLFKKVAAAVLAGVMALSMVACANTPVTPGTDIPDPDPVLTVEQQFLQMLNEGGELVAKKATFTEGYTVTYPTFENTLKAEAEKVLNAVEAGEKIYDTDGKVKQYKLTADIDLDTGVAAWVVPNTGVVGFTDTDKDDVIDVKKGNNDFAYDKDKAKAWVLSILQEDYEDATGWLKAEIAKVGTKTKSVKVISNFDIGVASKTINGQECVVVVTKPVND